MADQPLVLTESDVKDPNLLLRYLRKSADQIQALSNRLKSVESVPPAPTIPVVRNSLQAAGPVPINVTGLLGVLAQPQPASASVYSVAPTGQVLQSLRDQQLVLVGTASTGFSLNYVQGGNPNTLFQLTAGLSTTSVTSTSTNLAYVNVDNNFSTGQTVKMSLNTPAQITVQNTSTTGNIAQSRVRVLSDTGDVNEIGIFNSVCAAYGIINPHEGYMYTNSTALTFMIDKAGGVFKFAAGGNTQVAALTSAGSLSLNGKITNYNGDTLVGNGVGTIVARATGNGLSGTQTASLFTPPSLGEYILSYYVYTQTAGTDVITPTLGWIDSSSTHSFAPNTVTLGASAIAFSSVYMLCGTSTPIQLKTASAAGTGTYSLVATLQRLS